MTNMAFRRALVSVAAAIGMVLLGAGACEGGPGVPAEGEQGDGYGNGGDVGEEGSPGEGGAGDEIGGGS